MKLHLAPQFALPPEAVTETFAILAKRGVGKTYTAKKLAEQMLKAGIAPVVIADPIGVWWGLRSSADGCQWCHLRYDERFHRQTRCTRKDAARPLLAEAVNG